MSSENIAQSLLSRGNDALQANEYAKAIQHYLRLLKISPVLSKKLAMVDSLILARRRYCRERASGTLPEVAICSFELMTASDRRVDLLIELYHPIARVEIFKIGPPGSSRQRSLHSHSRRDITVQLLTIEDERRFTEHVMEFVLAHPYDVVHLAGPGMPELIVGLLYKIVWGASILFHIHEADAAHMLTNAPLTLNAMMQSEAPLDSLTDSSSNRLAMSLARSFDQFTVANPQLEAVFGGITIPPISPEAQAACLKYPSRSLAPELQRLCASPLLGSLFRILPWAPAENRNGVSIIILTLNGSTLLNRLLETFFHTNTHQPVELIIVDHGSVGDPADQTPSIIANYRGFGELCHIQRGANYSFSASCNLAAQWARFPNLLFLNNDIIYSSDALPAAVQKLDEPDIGIVGLRLDDDPDSLNPGQEPGIQHLGIKFTWSELRGYHHPRQIRQASLKDFLATTPSDGSLQPAVTGAFLLCQKNDFEALGGFSDAYDYGLEDIDFCLRMNRDLDKKCWCLTSLGIQHAESSTRRRDKTMTQERIERNHRHFKKVWHHQTAQLAQTSDAPRLIPPNTSKILTQLNVLFVLPQALDSNSGYHVQLHAARLQDQGVDCVVASPDAHFAETTGDLRTCSYSQVLASRSQLFRDGRAPDVIHAWTPREIVRQFVEKFRDTVNCRLVIHLEDNEEYLTEVALNQAFAELANLPLAELDKRIPAHRYHPVRGRRFLDQADGLTLIIVTLQRFNVRGIPSLILPPPVDERLFYPRPLNRELRQAHGIPDSHCVLAYTGNVHQANKHEVAELYRAVDSLNQQGHPTHLLRTGLNGKNTNDVLKPSNYVHELGWVQRERIPEVLAAADILVQPGDSGVFNDQRVPSKLPEYFAMGRPIIVSQSHISFQSPEYPVAYVLESATSNSIGEAITKIRQKNSVAENLSQAGRKFYEHHWRISEAELINFMHRVMRADTTLATTGKRKNKRGNFRLTYLKDRHAGERCVLVANGPSLNYMDLSFLRNETCIGMNKIYLGMKRFKFYPRYYVAVNLKVVKQAAKEIQALNCVKFIGQAAAQGIFEENALTYIIPTLTCHIDHEGIRRPGFCHDLAKDGMHEGWTVTHAALQIAYYLGFAEVIIIGMDHRYDYSGSPNEARVLEGPDLNHFSPDYFGGGQVWDNPDLEKSEESYRLARKEYEKSGRRILDATLGGACSVFEKADYRQIFNIQEPS